MRKGLRRAVEFAQSAPRADPEDALAVFMQRGNPIIRWPGGWIRGTAEITNKRILLALKPIQAVARANPQSTLAVFKQRGNAVVA